MTRMLLLLLVCLPLSLRAQSAKGPDAAIQQVLNDQVAAWNRGDIPAFMQGYKDAEDTTFVGKTVQHGYRAILERYRRSFPDKAAMGTLAFSELQVRPLDARYAIVTGRFHLERDAAGGGPAAGVFSLIFESTAAGWKIILDHSS